MNGMIGMAVEVLTYCVILGWWGDVGECDNLPVFDARRVGAGLRQLGTLHPPFVGPTFRLSVVRDFGTDGGVI